MRRYKYKRLGVQLHVRGVSLTLHIGISGACTCTCLRASRAHTPTLLLRVARGSTRGCACMCTCLPALRALAPPSEWRGAQLEMHACRCTRVRAYACVFAFASRARAPLSVSMLRVARGSTRDRACINNIHTYIASGEGLNSRRTSICMTSRARHKEATMEGERTEARRQRRRVFFLSSLSGDRCQRPCEGRRSSAPPRDSETYMHFGGTALTSLSFAAQPHAPARRRTPHALRTPKFKSERIH